VGGPITATSANRSGEEAATRAAHAGLPGVALVLDVGERAQPPSTVLELIDAPRLLRQGAVRIDGL
jgi:tRNA A37 threonylcarbamoyladenosine synthetase subunit TsaC/SUA5/YrdC